MQYVIVDAISASNLAYPIEHVSSNLTTNDVVS